MAHVPPVALSAHAGGLVYLLEWQEREPGQWAADIAWIVWDGMRWAGRRTRVPADDLTQVEGQPYKGVVRVTFYELRRREQREGS